MAVNMDRHFRLNTYNKCNRITSGWLWQKSLSFAVIWQNRTFVL